MYKRFRVIHYFFLSILILAFKPDPSFASGKFGTSLSFGPDDYQENRSVIYLDLTPHMGINASTSFYKERYLTTTEEYQIEAIVFLHHNLTMSGGYFLSPPSNNLKSYSLFGSVDFTLFRAGLDKDGQSRYKTTVSVSGETKELFLNTYFQNRYPKWYNLNQDSMGISLNQTVLKDYYFEISYISYHYDRDLNMINTALLKRIRTRQPSFVRLGQINALGFISGLPSKIYTVTLGAQLFERLHIDGSCSKIHFELYQPAASLYTIGLDFSLLQNLELNLELNLPSSEASEDIYYTGGITYYF
ncbi:MAG: hypothetical protein FJ241_03635 [Nitrospira sp.]|nr:hypothetical protein [Nitrospira sp.]